MAVSEEQAAGAAAPRLERSLSAFDTFNLSVGSIIGSGIFMAPAVLATQLPSLPLIAAAWGMGALMSLLGSLCIAELGAAQPEAGGLTVYLRSAFGPVWGFLYGWTTFSVIQTASIAALTVALAESIGHITPLSLVAERCVAIGAIAFLTGLNVIGVREGVWTQNVVTLAKVVLFVGLFVLSFVLSGHGVAPVPAPAHPPIRLITFCAAIMGPLWAFDGWIQTSYVAGEIKNPARNLPLATILSVVAVAVVYLLFNACQFKVLGVGGVARSSLPVADTANAVLGRVGGVFVAVLVVMTLFSSTSGVILAGARVNYAMAREGLFFRVASRIHPRFKTPAAALVLQGVWGALLVLSGRYDQLLTYLLFASWAFYGLGGVAVIVMRRKFPQLPRPYRVPGYLFTLLVFIIASAGLLVSSLVSAPRDSLVGLGLMLSGLPFYAFWRRRARPAAATRVAAVATQP
jgi:APA family basic amino acid/polyamine antiporter